MIHLYLYSFGYKWQCFILFHSDLLYSYYCLRNYSKTWWFKTFIIRTSLCLSRAVFLIFARLVYETAFSSKKGRWLCCFWLGSPGWPGVGPLRHLVFLQQVRVGLFSWWQQDSRRSRRDLAHWQTVTSTAFCWSS